MTLFLDDGDVRLYHGDALETVRQMPDESIDCVVTSPPYWGLRDYGTGSWDGGDPDCDHNAYQQLRNSEANPGSGSGAGGRTSLRDGIPPNECECGARRVDRQMGLEPTPDLFVAGMVELFREIRRVLAPHGTCWVNLGDSYAHNTETHPANNGTDPKMATSARGRISESTGVAKARGAGLKPKDLVGIPWRTAFALQADGWWLRSDIIWAKPNPMPESVTDRPTKAHEYVFLLTKQPRYWFDTEAVREPVSQLSIDVHSRCRSGGSSVGKKLRSNIDRGETPENSGLRNGTERDLSGRNVRSVWQIVTQPYPEAHFATFPEELARRCILAGCPVRVCRVCGKPSERIVEAGPPNGKPRKATEAWNAGTGLPLHRGHRGTDNRDTVGWSDCGHNAWRAGRVLDPFIGSGTTAKVARDHQRHAIGIDLNAQYLELAARRLQQLSLLT